METIYFFREYSQCVNTQPNKLQYMGQTDGTDISKELYWNLCKDSANINEAEDGSLFECASERTVWTPGDTRADFGDYTEKAVWESELDEREKALLTKKGILEIEEETESRPF